MFAGSSSESSEASAQRRPRRPFSAIKAAADAQARKRVDRQQQKEDESQAHDETLVHPPPAHRTRPNHDHKPEHRQPRYIATLVTAAAQRREQAARVTERRLVDAQQREAALFPDRDRFVTPAYKRKLQRDQIREEEERREEAQESMVHNSARAAVLEDTTSAQQPPSPAGTQPSTRHSATVKPLEGRQLMASSSEPKRRRTRFADAPTSGTTPASTERPAVSRRVRALRRNDAHAIEAYRQRYLLRRAKRAC